MVLSIPTSSTDERQQQQQQQEQDTQTLGELSPLFVSGRYVDVLCSQRGREVVDGFVRSLISGSGSESKAESNMKLERERGQERDQETLIVALAALNAFLQANVTGPVLEGGRSKVTGVFAGAAAAITAPKKASGVEEEEEDEKGGKAERKLKVLREKCFRSLDVDGVSVYPYIPHIELFCLARWVFLVRMGGGDLDLGLDGLVKEEEGEGEGDVAVKSLQWLIWRIRVGHFKLLSQPSLGSGSVFVKGGQWSDVPSLQQEIENGVDDVEAEVFGEGKRWKARDQVLFLIEKANVCIMLGQDLKAREALRRAREMNGFLYALSGALGKRTRFQEKSISQLVVLAKSGEPHEETGPVESKPQALALNDDTLLENLEFTKEERAEGPEHKTMRDLPDALKELEPDDQPQLSPLDQIILLTEGTLKDAFSPADTLTSEEILPFAARVISDRSTNWQIYTQALIVRSRIEVHRSRTVERGVLQMQAVVDQVVVETAVESEAELKESNGDESETRVPEIRIVGEDGESERKEVAKPTSFFPAAKPDETAPAQVRLQYIHALSSSPKWHLESELAYSWASVGSLVSALEIFKRLRMWAEVALCLASNAASNDEDGRGSGGEEKARAVLRWRLFHRSGASASGNKPEDIDEDLDISELKAADFHGPERTPPPPGAPRLFCILGDIENDPALYERAWEISNQRFARAQKSLGEHYLQQKNLVQAQDAYKKAVAVNRMSSELWNRLGDISLRLGEFSDASDAFGRAIACANNTEGGEDARTWSNLGSALYSLYLERVKELKKKKEEVNGKESSDGEVDNSLEDTTQTEPAKRDPSTLLSQSLAAYKRGASISHDNWRIWDNVITLGSRLRPVAVSEILLALRNVIRIRNTEDALDIIVLRLLLNESVLSQPKKEDTASTNSVYDPPRGSTERAVCEVIETLVVPLITIRSELWELVTRERIWRRDYAGAIDAAERAWRAAIGAAAGGGLLPSSGTGDNKRKSWLEDKDEWQVVVERTEELVSVLENYGDEVPEIGAKWKGKARNAVRSVIGKAKESWEGTEEWERLKGLLDGLR